MFERIIEMQEYIRFCASEFGLYDKSKKFDL